MILFATLLSFTIVIIDHQRINQVVMEDNEFQMEQTQNTVTYTLNTIEKVYYYFDQETALQMEENSYALAEHYEENPSFESWDFHALSEEYGMDIYIINEDHVIIGSNVAEDVGMDFTECCGKLVRVLEKRRESGDFFHDGLDIEQSTGTVKKFSYMATKDKKYLIELGYSLQDGPIFQEFDIFQVIEDLIVDYPMIYDINVLTLGGSSLGKSTEEWQLTSDRREAFENTLYTGEVTEIEREWQGQRALYRYFPYKSEYDEGEVTQNKVVELIYKGDQLEEVMNQNKRTFILQLGIILIITVIVSSIISQWMSKPIYLAFHDSLTGLKNRAGFKEDLENVLARSKGTTGVYMVDLDNFKLVNDYFGHDRGDALLRQSAKTILSAVPAHAKVYRMGGDEFSMIVPYITKQKAEKLAILILDRLKQTFENEADIRESGIEVSASVGFALSPEHGSKVSELYKKADIALYKSKKGGKSQYHMYQTKAER
jgi:diguanylate cyclase (GGDEF)-like protein